MEQQRPGSFVVLAADETLCQQVAGTSTRLGRDGIVIESVDELVESIKAAPCAVIVDHDDPRGLAAIAALAPLLAGGVGGPGAASTTLLVVVRDVFDNVPPGPRIVVEVAALPDVMRLLARPPRDLPHRMLDQLVGVSLLVGTLDASTHAAAGRIAQAFGATRCVIGNADDTSAFAQRCRAAIATDATIVSRAEDFSRCESVIAVSLDDRAGRAGFLGIVANGVRAFDGEDRTTLQTLATRLGRELQWRATHDRAHDELDRLSNNPAIDPLLGVWNRPAIVRLLAMYLSTAQRLKQTLGVIVVDVADLKGLNATYGLQLGDVVLQRIADATRTQTRIEDLVGRWSGGSVVAVLQGSSFDGAHRAVARIKQMIDTSSIEVGGETRLGFTTRFGVCIAQPNEDASALLERAARLAKDHGPGVEVKPLDGGEDVGTTLGGTYRLVHEIGQGAMGVVYRAEDLALERPVAIKMLRPDLVEDVELVEQLRSEASLLARLQHANLVQVYSFAHSGGDAYIVMELVEGEALLQTVERHRLEDTTVPINEVLAIATELGSALDALHDHGVVHRDVKPANVIRDPFRARSVLVDVGIARRFEQLVETAGTPGYVAPEVIRGDEATHLSDVYGLASTIYTLLTLTSPWEDDERLVILTRQARGEQVPLLSHYRPELAPADDVMRSALSSDSTQRPSSAGAFARALVASLGGIAPMPSDKASNRARVILPRRVQAAQSNTRGVVFRSVSRALGVREADRLRDRLAADDPELARALTDASPLDWLPTAMFTRLLAAAPDLAGRDGASLARDVARATVRASFRRFFPASAATLIPERTMSVVRTVWSRYHSWGSVSCMPVRAGEVVIRMTDTPRVSDLCAFSAGLFEQLVVLSGGQAPHVSHESCQARGDGVCLYRVSWERT